VKCRSMARARRCFGVKGKAHDEGVAASEIESREMRTGPS
jgi:hypothetical protein